MKINLTAVPDKAKHIWQRYHWPMVAVCLAFMGGVVGADMWSNQRSLSSSSPQAEVMVRPMALPLVMGVNPIDRPLPSAPLPGLESNEAEGKLPVISAQGVAPFQAYAYPFDTQDARPRISVILTGVGQQANLLSSAINKLPGSVALAYNPTLPGLGQMIAAARQQGHETLLSIPADAKDTTSFDPGPGALRGSLSVNDNIQRLRLLMGKASGYVGLIIDPQTSLLTSPLMARALISESHQRGLQLLSDNEDFSAMALEAGAPAATLTMALDKTLDPADLDTVLAEAEQRARESGQVILTSAPYPFIIDRLASWLPTLSGKGLAIAPPSALASPLKHEAPAAEAHLPESAAKPETHPTTESHTAPAHETAAPAHH